jgi:prokaryotic ubiquitin-like protein Pup
MAQLKAKEAKPTTHTGETHTEEVTPAVKSTLTKRGADLKEDMDQLIDEIDDLLEENAEEFVASYVQRGGE